MTCLPCAAGLLLALAASLTGGAGGSRAEEAKKVRRAHFPSGLVRRALDAPVESVIVAGPGVKEATPMEVVAGGFAGGCRVVVIEEELRSWVGEWSGC